MPERGERHHIIYTEKVQNATKETKALRCARWLIPRIEHDPHAEIHKAVSIVPVLDYHMARRVLKEFYQVPNDYMATMDNLLFAVEEAMHNPKAGEIERGLGKLFIASIELQKPFIKEGLITP